MSDQTQVINKETVPSGSLRQRIFNIVGWVAFLLLAPPALHMLGLPALQDFLSDKIANWGSPVALVLYFYALLFLRVFFGSDQRYTPVLMGYAISFIYFSNSLDIGFMQWLRDLSAQVSFLAYPYMSFITGIVVIFLSNALSSAKKATWPIDLIVLGLLPAAGLVCAGIFLPGLLGL